MIYYIFVILWDGWVHLSGLLFQVASAGAEMSKKLLHSNA